VLSHSTCNRYVALLEKGVPFDTVFIDLRDKPQWWGGAS
jgi:glutathione S-transferase